MAHDHLRRHLPADRLPDRCAEEDRQGDPDRPRAGRDLSPDRRRADREGGQSHRRVRRSPRAGSISRHQQARRGAVADQPRRGQERSVATRRRQVSEASSPVSKLHDRRRHRASHAAPPITDPTPPVPQPRVVRADAALPRRRRPSPSSLASWRSCTATASSPMPSTSRSVGSYLTGSEDARRAAPRHWYAS